MPSSRQVHVDAQLCEAHALCVELAPEVFVLGDDIAGCDDAPAPTLHSQIEAAIAACPRQAISWLEH